VDGFRIPTWMLPPDARDVFDWAVVYRQYQALWAEMQRLRQAARCDPQQQAMLTAAPRTAASRMDPFRSFAHYATALIQDRTWVSLRAAADAATYAELSSHPLFNYAGKVLPAPAVVEALLAPIAQGELAMRELAGSGRFGSWGDGAGSLGPIKWGWQLLATGRLYLIPRSVKVPTSVIPLTWDNGTATTN
jgi:hypothetical protein